MTETQQPSREFNQAEGVSLVSGTDNCLELGSVYV